ncbi:ArsR/SmtB family transcription factor [Chloroflexota bacterium]
MEQILKENTEEQATVFTVLSDPTRLRLVKLLGRQPDQDALCVNALAGSLGVTQSAVSQHLRILKSIGLVTGERRGYHIHYFVNYEALEYCRNLVSTVLTIDAPRIEETGKNNCPIRREQNAP